MDQINADVMNRAWAALGQTPPPHINLYRDMWERAENVARAIQAYGDEHAREARAAAFAEAKQIARATADDELPEPHWDNNRARRMDWVCCAYRILDRIVDVGSPVRLTERQSSNAAAGVVRGDGTDTLATKSGEPTKPGSEP